MKIKQSTDSLGINLKRQHTNSNAAEKQVDSVGYNYNNDYVDIAKSREVVERLSVEEILEERSSKVDRIKREIQSGSYFENRSVSDIAGVLANRLGDDIELEKLFAKDKDE